MIRLSALLLLVGGAVALIAAGLPWRLALVAGSLAGVGAGVIYERAKLR